MPITEADTCRMYVLPLLHEAGWSDEQIAEQRTFTDGRIVVVGDKCWRGKQKRADYVLRYRRDFPIAIVEAKAAYKNPADGLQQAKEYAQVLSLKFAYSTNGHGIVEHDFITGRDNDLVAFPSPNGLWKRFSKSEEIDDSDGTVVDRLLTPCYRIPRKIPRYYQEIAINCALQAILRGKRRVLLTMATGTGKTFVAFQIIWKLWSKRWNRKGEHRRPRILFLADRNVLVEDPMSKDFAVFEDARWQIRGMHACTTGYVNVYIAKTLIQNIEDVEVKLNDDQTNYMAKSLDDSWLIHFTYSHSTHTATISLGSISAPFIETPVGKIVLYGIPITVVVLLVALYALKKKQPNP